MPDGSAPQRTLTTELRVHRPDGTSVEHAVTDDGRVTCVRRDDAGQELDRIVAELDADGFFRVSVLEPGQEPRPLEPVASRQLTNDFGAWVETTDYPEGLSVDRSFDNDSRMHEVTVRGPWGTQTITLRTDGSRAVEWETGAHRGRQSWNADGERIAYDVTFADGSSQRWRAERSAAGSREGGRRGA